MFVPPDCESCAARRDGEVARLLVTDFIMIYASAMALGLLTEEAEAEGEITIGAEFRGRWRRSATRPVCRSISRLGRVLR